MRIVLSGVRALNNFGSLGTSAIKTQGINKSLFQCKFSGRYLCLSHRASPGKQSL
jgi:hypothetical protein